MDDFTVVPQSLIKMLKRYAEKGFSEGTDYSKGIEDGMAAMAQATLDCLNVSYNEASIEESL